MSPSKASQAIDDILYVAQQITSIGKDASSTVPGLPVAFSALDMLIRTVIQVRGNEENRRDLAEDIKTLVEIIDNANKDAADLGFEAGMGKHGWSIDSPELEKRVKDLTGRLNDINTEARKLIQSRRKRILKLKSNADTLMKLRRDVDNAIRNYSLQSQIMIEKRVLEESAMNALKNLPHANSGPISFYNPTRSGVLEGTRIALLEDMTKWTLGPDPSGNDPLIYVLSGGAGTGKSTIAYEMAKRLNNPDSNPKSLGASFFFVRDVSKLSTAQYVLPTLAYQLATSQPKLRPHLVAAARKYTHQGKEGQHLEYDLEQLIIEPLMKVTSHHRVIIVMDALDECQESAQNDVVHLLYLLIQRIPKLNFQLRVLVTTRPEMHIQDALDSVDFRNVLKPFKMQDIPKVNADADIQLYLQENLSKESTHDLLLERPTLIDDLTRHADGLFIYAATLVLFLATNPFRPLETLDALLSNNLTDVAPSLGKLDQLYLTVLRNSFAENDLKSPEIQRTIMAVVGSLALVQDRVSANVLKALTGISTKDTAYVLKRLGSVIHMPKRVDGKMDEDAEIQMLHASFPQFIIDKNRCVNTKFYVNPIEHHTRLALDCLSTMTKNSALNVNICRLDDPLSFMKDIPVLPDLIKKYIPAHLQYGCVHWATHLKNSEPASELLNVVDKFVRRKLTPWIEVIAYMNRLPDGVIGLIEAYKWSKEKMQQGVKEDVPQIINDAYRLVLEFFSPISIRSLEIYNSVSIFAPHCKMTELYADSRVKNGNGTAVELVTRRETMWGTCLRVIETGGKNVVCVEYSPDGGLIASGLDDGRVQIWDSGVGTLKNTLLGHTNWINTIAWSPDGQWIVSGSDDKTWRVWNAGSGAEVHHQKADRKVNMVAWHANGKQIASVLQMGEMQVWDVEIGKAVKAVKLFPDIERVIAISKDFAHFVDRINNYSLRLWDTESGKVVMTMKGHTEQVYSAAFLNDTQIVSSGVETLVWDMATGNCVHSFGVTSFKISVSPKGDRFAVSGYYGIQIWDSHTWQGCGKLLPLSHTSPARDLSFSPNGERLVSASVSSFQLWDLAQLSTSKPQTAQPQTLNILFSPKHCYVAIVTKETITIWSPKPYSGEPFCILQGSFTEYVAFSPNAEKLALIDRGYKICVWSITTTLPTLLYTTSPGFDEAIAWSLDGCWIASITSHLDQWVCVFDAATGQLEKKLDVTLGGFPMTHELSLDSTILYVHSTHKGMYYWKEGKQVEVGTLRWETNIDRSKFLEEDGWVIRKENRRKLCWIPASRRYTDPYYHDSKMAMWQGHNYLGIISDSGQLTLLHISDDL